MTSHRAIEPASQQKDLRGYKCPMNYVHARLTLSELPANAALEIWVDVGEPEQSLPASLKRDGYTVESVQPLPDQSAVCVRVLNTARL